MLLLFDLLAPYKCYKATFMSNFKIKGQHEKYVDTILLFSVYSFLSLIFCSLYVPETKQSEDASITIDVMLKIMQYQNWVSQNSFNSQTTSQYMYVIYFYSDSLGRYLLTYYLKFEINLKQNVFN